MTSHLPSAQTSSEDPLDAYEPTMMSRLATYVRGGGVIVPLLTVLIAFVVGGLVVLVTGHNPLSAYKAIFDGTGLNWLFPWTHGSARTRAATDLQQTLIATTPLILVGLAVAFAFRAGLFNIGGQGQYLVGSYVGIWVGSSWAGMPHALHLILALVLGALAGGLWAAIAGALKATVGANEVISTIMLNWIAVWLGMWLVGDGGPLQGSTPSVPVSPDVADSAKLPVIWGNPLLQGLHIGIFIAIAAVVVFWLVLNRSTAGYEVRAVGFNPEAARYGGMSVARNYVRVMAICGLFAGLAGAIDILGWQFRIANTDVPISQVGFLGIAVALLGRNTASGTVAAALLFGALQTGTSQRHLDAEVFDPALAGNLTLIIQGLVVLIVSTDVLAVRLLGGVRRLIPGRSRPGGAPPLAPSHTGEEGVS